MAKSLTGIVTSDVRDKTITVTVTSRQTHPLYGKQYTVSRTRLMTKRMKRKKATKSLSVKSAQFQRPRALRLTTLTKSQLVALS